MATVRTPGGTWVGREGNLYIAKASDITFSNSTTLSGSFASAGYDISKAVKSMTVVPPETGYEKIDLLGKDSNSFQNQLLDEKPAGSASITATLIVGEDETIEDMLSGTLAASPAGYTRRQYGTDETSDTPVAVCVTMLRPDILKEKSYALDNARFVKLGDARLSDMASHWEQDITIICLAKDFYEETKD